jgi:uncharacterized protein
VAAVCDASPLIALNQIAQTDLLFRVFEEVLIPPAVAREIQPSLPAAPPWIRVRPLNGPLHSSVVAASLGEGEEQAISLAVEIRADPIILDDGRARRVARGLGLHVVGTVGVLMAAKRRRLVRSVRPHLDRLLASGFRLSADWYERALAEAGEATRP